MEENKIPKHIGIILDGNRRFAKRLMLKPYKGHEWGAEKLEKEFEKAKKDKKVFENKIKFNFIGRIHLFPKEIQKQMKDLMELTKEHDKFIVNFAMAYGGRAEIIDATKKIAQQVKE